MVSDTLCGPGVAKSIQVEVNSIVANVSQSMIHCDGDSTYLCVDIQGGTGTYSIQWSPDSLFANPSSSCTWVEGHSGLNYTLAIDNGNEQIYLAPTLAVNPLPDVLWNSSYLACYGEDIQLLEGIPVGGTFNGSYVSGNYFMGSQSGPGTHPISYLVTDSNGCSNSAFANVLVNDSLPWVKLEPLVPVLYPTEFVAFLDTNNSGGLVHADSVDHYSYQWYGWDYYQDTIAIAGATSGSLQINWEEYEGIFFEIQDTLSCSKTSSALLLFWESIEEYSQRKIKIYPNPSHSVLFLDTETDIESYKIYDSMGRLVESQLNRRNENSLDIQFLDAGFYSTEILSEGQVYHASSLKN